MSAPSGFSITQLIRFGVWCLIWGMGICGSIGALSAQEGDSIYWETYHVDILSKSDSLLPPRLPILDSTLADYRFFFVGEVHWRKLNTQIQWAFLKHLYEQAGVRNLIVEGGFAFSFLLNQYLKTGEERLLEKALTDIPSCPEDEAVFFRTLYRFNQNVPDSSRIIVTGIDVDKSPALSIQVLNTLLPDAPPPKSLFPLMKRIEELHYTRYFDPGEVRRYFKRLNRDMAAHPARYQAYWGENYPLLQLLVANTLEGYKFTFVRSTFFQKAWQRREERMYENFLALQPFMAKGAFFGQFGALHTDLKRSARWEFPTLAHRLNHFTNSPVSNKVLTISRFAGKVVKYDRIQGGTQLKAWMAFLDQAHSGKVVLCSLVGKESPFGELGENFQYILWVDEDMDQQACD